VLETKLNFFHFFRFYVDQELRRARSVPAPFDMHGIYRDEVATATTKSKFHVKLDYVISP
jgi:hypothetical protein